MTREHHQCRIRRAAAALACLLGLLIMLPGLPAQAAWPSSAKPAAILVDADTGRILDGDRHTSERHPASLTKMMTLYLLFDSVQRGELSLKSRMQVSAAASRRPASKLGLRPGSHITVDDAINALVIRSANDVAVVVAEAISGSEAAFARRMTAKARAMGMSRTTFRNANGLHHPQQVTTATDMAVLAIRLRRDFPGFHERFKRQKFSWGNRTYTSHNRFLKNFSGADGLKTGYIRASGFNLAASAVRDGRTVIGVVFGGRSSRARDQRMVELMARGFRLANNSRLQLAGSKFGNVPASLGRHTPTADMVSTTVARLSLVPPERPGASTAPLSVPALSLLSKAARAAPALQGRHADAGRTATAGSHVVQVGAFSARASAASVAGKAHRMLGGRYATTGPEVIARSTSQGETLYRARIAGFSETQARQACALLKRQRQDCLVVSRQS